MTDAYFTYLNKKIVDTAIIPGNLTALIPIAIIYGTFIFLQAVFVFSFIYLAGILGERVQYDLRKMMFEHLQELSLSYYCAKRGWPLDRARHIRFGTRG